jgi:hypothetical protein
VCECILTRAAAAAADRAMVESFDESLLGKAWKENATNIILEHADSRQKRVLFD